MAKPTSARPTDAELAILRVLWRRGPCTVRKVHEELGGRGTAYTTRLKQLQIMAEKGLVARDETNRSHVYRAVVGEERTQRQMLGDLLERAFGGSARSLVLQLLASKKASPEEVAEIRRLLDDHSPGTT